MNKALIMVMLLFTLKAANAQTEKGNQNLGVNLGYHHIKDTPTSDVAPYGKSSNNQYSISAAYSYFIANNLDIGVDAGYYYSNHEENYSRLTKGNAHGLGATIQLRKYFLFQSKIGIRTGPYLSYMELNNDEDNTIYFDKRKTAMYNGGIGADLVYYPTKRIGLATRLGALEYRYSKTTGDNRSSGSGLSLALTNGVSFYVYYVL